MEKVVKVEFQYFLKKHNKTVDSKFSSIEYEASMVPNIGDIIFLSCSPDPDYNLDAKEDLKRMTDTSHWLYKGFKVLSRIFISDYYTNESKKLKIHDRIVVIVGDVDENPWEHMKE